MQKWKFKSYLRGVLMLVSFVQLLDGHCPTKLRTGRYKQAIDYKLKEERVMASYTHPSASACLSRCATVTECMGVSWNPDSLECQLSDREILHANQVRGRLVVQPPWISYGEMIFNAWMVEGADGRYSMTFSEAKARCAVEDSRLVTTDGILQLRTDGFELCYCTWLDDGVNGVIGFVMQSANLDCWASFHTGIIECGSATEANALCTDDLDGL